MGKTARLRRLVAATVLLSAALIPIFPLTARGCSCMTPADLHEWVDQSEAVFVGALVEKRDLGGESFESIYVFEVEEWIKGDAGDVIEVHSASDGAGCGFEFWDVEQRTGAAIYVEDGVLRGGLCSQIDADVALTLKNGVATSKTGIPRIMVGNGWSSTRLTLLDADGGHITDLLPAEDPADFVGTQLLETCPGGERMVQVTSSELIVWDTATFEPVAVHQVGASQWGSDVSCRAGDASSILFLSASDTGSRLVEFAGTTETALELPGTNGWIGTDYVLSQLGPEGDITWIDMATGEATPIATVPPGELWSLSAAPHPTEGRAALMETRFDQEDTVSILSIVNRNGERSRDIELDLEAYAPTWLDEQRLLVTGYDWEVSEIPIGLVVDTETDEVTEVGPWNSIHNVAAGDQVYGVDGGSVIKADLSTGSVETLATLPNLDAGPLVILDAAEALEVATSTVPVTEPTVPPLVAPGLEAAPGVSPEPDLSTYTPWIAGGAMTLFFGLLAWLLRTPPTDSADPS